MSTGKRGHRLEALRLAAIGDWKLKDAPFRDMQFRDIRLVDATSEVLGNGETTGLTSTRSLAQRPTES
ncbi:hypothetical protein [Massilia oculi]|uniref:hypothetical protein n=1 Tax=Massilia oculi TaxID=945844 RepID=UPI001E5C0015|nr:hypothetical protein [Massilia oculi]